MDACFSLKKKMHKEKISFIKERGICFGCLVPGHMSKNCYNRLTCKVCNQSHPTVLHIGREKERKLERGERSETSRTGEKAILKACGHIGASEVEEECVLSIVPVKVKSNKGNQIIQTYAFLDPGSTASFCTSKLMNQLNMSGKKTNILLRTMGQEKTVSSHIITGLEVSELHGNRFTPLPEIYTQKIMPVTKHNIPNQKDLSKWPYLSQIKLPLMKKSACCLVPMHPKLWNR